MRVTLNHHVQSTQSSFFIDVSYGSSLTYTRSVKFEVNILQ